MKLVLAVISLVLLVSSSFACSCFPSTWKDTFCDAKWVARVRVNTKSYVTIPGAPFNKIYYDVKHIEIFRGPPRLGCSLVTVEHTAGCGVPYLQVNTDYVVAGDYEDGSLSLSLCHYVYITDIYSPEWSKIPYSFKQKLRNAVC